jgi:ABC-2 type transport system ATP-binding protein
MKVTIELGHVRVASHGTVILDDISLSTKAGQVVGLLGPSGAGKTTLMRVIVGLQAVTHGKVRVLGMPAGSRELRSVVGYVTQAPSVYLDLSVGENLRYFARLVGVDEERVLNVTEMVHLSAKQQQLVASLSGGERARVSLAVALLGEPDILVLDEPTVGLDPILRRELWDVFHQLAQRGTTLLISSHVMDEARRCDQLLLLRAGHIIASATPERLMAQTHTSDVESAFLALVEATP